MEQKLILPINRCKLTASYKTGAYLSRFGFMHYGADMVSTDGNPLLYASGNGAVVAAGRDSVVGNTIAIRYPTAWNRAARSFQDVVIRYFHLAKCAVKPGQSVTKDTVIGCYGNTGMLVMAPHLHIEADADADHPLYSPTVKSGSFLKGTLAGANDKTMYNPIVFLHVKRSAPDNQTYVTANDAFIRPEDKSIPLTGDGADRR